MCCMYIKYMLYVHHAYSTITMHTAVTIERGVPFLKKKIPFSKKNWTKIFFFKVPYVGIEPTTTRLRVLRSTD